MALVHNDLRNRYRRSVLGLGWSLLQPIAMTIVLCTVFAGVFNVTLSEYAPYLLSGLTFWGFISTAAIAGCQSFFQGESYIRQHRAPLAMYPLRTTLGAGYHFLVGMGVVLAAVGIFSGFDNPLVLLSLVPSLALLARLRLVAGRMHGHAQRALPRHATPAGDHPADPVLPDADHLQARDPRQAEPGLGRQFNPFAVLLDLIRQPLLEGALPSLRDDPGQPADRCDYGRRGGALARWCERRLVFFLNLFQNSETGKRCGSNVCLK